MCSNRLQSVQFVHSGSRAEYRVSAAVVVHTAAGHSKPEATLHFAYRAKTAPAAAAAAAAANGSSDSLECPLCMRLLWEPVATPCAHLFCRTCFARSCDYGNKCPSCRTVIDLCKTLSSMSCRPGACQLIYEFPRYRTSCDVFEVSWSSSYCFSSCLVI